MGMELAIEELPNWKVEKRYTEWYVWKCPEPHCRKRIEATVQRYVAVLAQRHLNGHKTRERKEIHSSRLLQEVGRA